MTTPLHDYHAKRDFSKTTEPRGASTADASPHPLTFVVQKHDARRLHYDFRLELDGVLKSWAVPKGPSDLPSDKRLAVMTEDHPLDYASFEGVIPHGEYGAGPVIVWDRGTWEPEDADPSKALKKGRLKFTLHGTKLRGRWALVRMKDADDQWLLMKDRDPWAASSRARPLVDREPASVVSGRLVEELAARKKPAPRPSAPRLPQAEVFRPSLATLVDSAPPGDAWLHEVKYDGYRILVRVENGRASLITRNGHDWTSRFGDLAESFRGIPDSAVIDGEMVVLDARGLSSFHRLQQALKHPAPGGFTFFAFDLLWVGADDLRRRPLVERKQLLQTLLPPSDVIRFSDHLVGNGPAFHAQACRSGLEGIISKRAASIYAGSRSNDWLKVKCLKRQEFVIGGFTDPSGGRTGFGSLLLGVHDEERGLVYAGKVGTGFNEETLTAIKSQLDARVRSTPPFDVPPAGRDAAGAHWVEPQLVAEVSFTEWTSDGRLRHPSFQGLREDKPPSQIVREKPRPSASHPSSSIMSHHGVTITHPERAVFPDAAITKGQLADYYAAVADHLLPHIAGRPLSVVRCPQGRQHACFFQKHRGKGMPDEIETVRIEEDDGPADYLTVDSPGGLLSLVQFGVLEIHPWLSRNDRPERPDMMVFDLDPGDGVDWLEVLGAAHLLREVLRDLDLESFPKVTGGKGLHLVVPIARTEGFDVVKPASKAIVERLRSRNPGRFVTTSTKAKRTGRIYLDYLRNGRGATAVAPFSTRARPGAPVAAPVSWDEVEPALRPDAFTILNLPQRLALGRDPWDGFFSLRQTLRKSALRELGTDMSA